MKRCRSWALLAHPRRWRRRVGQSARRRVPARRASVRSMPGLPRIDLPRTRTRPTHLRRIPEMGRPACRLRHRPPALRRVTGRAPRRRRWFRLSLELPVPRMGSCLIWMRSPLRVLESPSVCCAGRNRSGLKVGTGRRPSGQPPSPMRGIRRLPLVHSAARRSWCPWSWYPERRRSTPRLRVSPSGSRRRWRPVRRVLSRWAPASKVE